MAYGSARRIAVPAEEPVDAHPRRVVVVAVWVACLIVCLSFWVAVGLAVWWLVT